MLPVAVCPGDIHILYNDYNAGENSILHSKQCTNTNEKSKNFIIIIPHTPSTFSRLPSSTSEIGPENYTQGNKTQRFSYPPIRTNASQKWRTQSSSSTRQPAGIGQIAVAVQCDGLPTFRGLLNRVGTSSGGLEVDNGVPTEFLGRSCLRLLSAGAVELD